MEQEERRRRAGGPPSGGHGGPAPRNRERQIGRGDAAQLRPRVVAVMRLSCRAPHTMRRARDRRRGDGATRSPRPLAPPHGDCRVPLHGHGLATRTRGTTPRRRPRPAGPQRGVARRPSTGTVQVVRARCQSALSTTETGWVRNENNPSFIAIAQSRPSSCSLDYYCMVTATKASRPGPSMVTASGNRQQSDREQGPCPRGGAGRERTSDHATWSSYHGSAANAPYSKVSR